MTFSQFKTILRFLEKNAADSCGVVCYSDNECDGHRCLNYLRQYDNFMTESVENREIFYRNIEIIKNSKNTDPMMGYIFLPKDLPPPIHTAPYSKYLKVVLKSAMEMCDESMKYGNDYDVRKDCIGHIQKRMGSALRTFKNNTKGIVLSDDKSVGGVMVMPYKIIKEMMKNNKGSLCNNLSLDIAIIL